MTWRTHAAVGANALWLTAFFDYSGETLLLLLPLSLLASLLPDLDATAAKIHFVGGGIFGAFRSSDRKGLWQHRGVLHSLFAVLLLFTACLVMLGKTYPTLPYVVAVAYCSHLIIDGFNAGVGYLFPFYPKKLTFWPQLLRGPVGGLLDNLLFVSGLLGLLWFFLLSSGQLLPLSNSGFF